MDSRGRAEPHFAVGRCSLLGRVQTGCSLFNISAAQEVGSRLGSFFLHLVVPTS